MRRVPRHAPSTPARILILAVLLGAALRPAAAGAPPDLSPPIPLPANESEAVLSRWLTGQGFDVSRERLDDGGARLSARRDGRAWEILVVPASPLASRLRAGYSRDGKDDPGTAAAARERLLRYAAGDGRREPAPGPLDAPPVVREKAAAVVCLAAAPGAREPIRFSGVVVDGRGTVVSTAHDLEAVDELTARVDGGPEAAARMVRRDAGRDLSLIRIRSGAPPGISLAGARDDLDEGEPVFAVACPGSLRPVIRAGLVSGPPRKANGMLLWPVAMDTPPGSSGGPVFDAAGRFVGIVKGHYRGAESYGFVIPARTVVDFLRSGAAAGGTR